jgi:hypothetical protein
MPTHPTTIRRAKEDEDRAREEDIVVGNGIGFGRADLNKARHALKRVEWHADHKDVAAAKKMAADPTHPTTIRRAQEDDEYTANETEARDALNAGEKTCVHGGVDVVMSTGAARSQLECMRDLLCL